jgi:hypothetical protein
MTAWAVEPLTGAELLDDVESFIARFVAFPSEAAQVAVTLWAVHTHLVQAGENSPRLALLSPEPGSGKTRTLEVLELLTPTPLHALSASPAAVFRLLQVEQTTLLMDEVDAIFTRRRGGDDGAEDLRALLNAGHRKGATIPRCVGPRHDVARFPVYAAVALAGLGDLPDTLMDRSLIIRMRRRGPGETIEQFRRRLHLPDGETLRVQIAEWAVAVADDIADAWPVMPDGVENRQVDCWEPLLAIADAAGDTWPDRARSACVELCKVSVSREASLGVRLLGDLRDVFGEADALATQTILDRLCDIDEAPWGDLHGKELDARGLARRLRQYQVFSVKVKVEGRSLQGYRREHLWDTWQRYLPADRQEGEPGEPEEPARSEAMSGVPQRFPIDDKGNPKGTRHKPVTSEVPEVPQVPHSRCRACAVEMTHEQAAVSTLCADCLGRAREATS